MSSAAVRHPLSDLTAAEIGRARDIVVGAHKDCVLDFRLIYLFEPPKAEVLPFLALEHAGKITADTPRPPRLAQVKYDVIGASRVPEYHESEVNIETGEIINHEVVSTDHHASLTVYVWRYFGHWPQLSATILIS